MPFGKLNASLLYRTNYRPKRLYASVSKRLKIQEQNPLSLLTPRRTRCPLIWESITELSEQFHQLFRDSLAAVFLLYKDALYFGAVVIILYI